LASYTASTSSGHSRARCRRRPPTAFLFGIADLVIELAFCILLGFIEAPGAGAFIFLRIALVLAANLAVCASIGRSNMVDVFFGLALALLNVLTWQTKEMLQKTAGRLWLTGG
jgi:hypothetical protein